ncbi:MAG: FUSC family protein [Methylobacteriaceae bacterium]|nr:FUSC family protein [Methylobacteriaceae bacterium]
MTMSVASKHLALLGPCRWNQIAPGRAFRGAVGVVIPLVVGAAAGRVEYGAYAALGALPAGFVTFQGEARGRVGAVVIASVGMAVSTFVGATTAATAPWALVPAIALWGYVAGLSVALGQRWSVAILQWSVALLISVGLPMEHAEALLRALLVLGGGLFQAGLVGISWALRPGLHEREALAESYRALAAYASDLSGGKSGAPPSAAFPARMAVADSNPLLPSAMRLAFLDLLEEAERIRASLAALAAGKGKPELGMFLQDIAAALTLIAHALVTERARRLPLISELRRKLANWSVAPEEPWRWAGEGLLGQLRAVGHLSARIESRSPQKIAGEATSHERVVMPAHAGAQWVLLTLRANLTHRSEAGRHALRLAAIAALAEAIIQATGFYQGRWVALTIFIILKPDYASTLYRGVQRAVGTAIGAGLGAMAAMNLPGVASQTVTAGMCVAGAYALFDASYLLFSVFLTAFIMVLLSLLGSPALLTAEARFLDTFIGAALGLAAYLAWPTWEGMTAHEKFAQMLDAHRDYAAGLLRVLARLASMDALRLRALQTSARRARNDAEAATVRLGSEPAHPPLTPATAEAIIAAVTRLALAELALHAYVLAPGATTQMNEPEATAQAIRNLAAAVETAMSRLALALRQLARPQRIPALRPIQAELRADPALTDAGVVDLTDRMVDAVDTIDAILRDRLPTGPDHCGNGEIVL